MRTVLILGGDADGMRIQQKKDTSKIQMAIEGRGLVTFFVSKVEFFGASHFFATEQQDVDVVDLLFKRYPASVHQ